jgi:hypothetical protein
MLNYRPLSNDHGVAATRAGRKDAAVRESAARVAGVDARAPWLFHAKRFGNATRILKESDRSMEQSVFSLGYYDVPHFVLDFTDNTYPSGSAVGG